MPYTIAVNLLPSTRWICYLPLVLNKMGTVLCDTPLQPLVQVLFVAKMWCSFFVRNASDIIDNDSHPIFFKRCCNCNYYICHYYYCNSYYYYDRLDLFWLWVLNSTAYGITYICLSSEKKSYLDYLGCHLKGVGTFVECGFHNVSRRNACLLKNFSWFPSS